MMSLWRSGSGFTISYPWLRGVWIVVRTSILHVSFFRASVNSNSLRSPLKCSLKQTMCRPVDGQRALVANGPKLENELKQQKMSINRLSKNAVVDRNTIRSMLRSRKAYESSFRKIARVLFRDENEWARLTTGNSCVIVTFDFDCELPEGADSEDALNFIRQNPERFIECFEKISDLTSTPPQIADVTVACIRIRMVATSEDAQKLVDAFEANEFKLYGVEQVFIESLPGNQPDRRSWRWPLLIGLATVSIIASTLLVLAPMLSKSGDVIVTNLGEPIIDQRSVNGELVFVPGRRSARIGVNVQNLTSTSVRVGDRCRFNFTNIGIDHDVFFNLQIRESSIVESRGKTTAVFAVNNIDTIVRNLSWSPRKGHVRCMVFVSMIDVTSGELIKEIGLPVFVLPSQNDKPGQR